MVSTVGGTVKVKVSTIECGWKSSLCKPSQIWSVFFADGEERRKKGESAATLLQLCTKARNTTRARTGTDKITFVTVDRKVPGTASVTDSSVGCAPLEMRRKARKEGEAWLVGFSTHPSLCEWISASELPSVREQGSLGGEAGNWTA